LAAYSIILIIGLVLGSGSVAILWLGAGPGDDLIRDTAVDVAVNYQDFDDMQTAVAHLQLTAPTDLILHVTGTVTGVAGGNDVLESGSLALSVDGRPIIALNTSVPLFRDLAIGDQGVEVAAVNVELARLSSRELPGDVFTAESLDAWQGLQRVAGVTPEERKLRLADVIWIPMETTRVTDWARLLGSQVIDGASVGQAVPVIAAMDLEASNELAVLPGPRNLTIWGQTAQVDSLEESVPAEYLKALSLTTDFSEILLAGPPYAVAVQATLLSPVVALRVPPGAIFGVAGNHGCLLVSGSALPVTILGASLGGSMVTVNTSQAVEVVTIGQDTRDLSCPV
jgi:hypothetical protein